MDSAEKIRALLETAADLWETRGDSFEMEELAARSGIAATEISERFSGKEELIEAYFADLATRAGENLDGLIGDMSFEERIGAFSFMMLDLFEERLPLAQRQFDKHAARWGSPFRAQVGVQVQIMLDAKDVPGINQLALQSEMGLFAIVETFVTAVKAWLRDESDSRERATALVDKLVGLLGAGASSRTFERGVDVFRYAVSAGYLPRIPLLSDWLMGDSEERHQPEETRG